MLEMDEVPQAQDPADYDYDPDSETQLPIDVYEGMSERTVSGYLKEQGIPEKYCDIFEGMCTTQLDITLHTFFIMYLNSNKLEKHVWKCFKCVCAIVVRTEKKYSRSLGQYPAKYWPIYYF